MRAMANCRPLFWQEASVRESFRKIPLPYNTPPEGPLHISPGLTRHVAPCAGVDNEYKQSHLLDLTIALSSLKSFAFPCSPATLSGVGTCLPLPHLPVSRTFAVLSRTTYCGGRYQLPKPVSYMQRLCLRPGNVELPLGRVCGPRLKPQRGAGHPKTFSCYLHSTSVQACGLFNRYRYPVALRLERLGR